ncbi:hypothetical protein CPB86DRAFT_781561 [Serendipita vermifera]|nr:hypothetical protein CPB86DRAFT_781561 [Serendipita vermifera]
MSNTKLTGATILASSLCSTLHGHSPSADANAYQCNQVNGRRGGGTLLDMQMWRPHCPPPPPIYSIHKV